MQIPPNICPKSKDITLSLKPEDARRRPRKESLVSFVLIQAKLPQRCTEVSELLKLIFRELVSADCAFVGGETCGRSGAWAHLFGYSAVGRRLWI